MITHIDDPEILRIRNRIEKLVNKYRKQIIQINNIECLDDQDAGYISGSTRILRDVIKRLEKILNQ